MRSIYIKIIKLEISQSLNKTLNIINNNINIFYLFIYTNNFMKNNQAQREILNFVTLIEKGNVDQEIKRLNKQIQIQRNQELSYTRFQKQKNYYFGKQIGNMIYGSCVFHHNKNVIYKGEFQNNFIKNGTMTINNNIVYQGSFVNNLKDGKGVQYIYQGQQLVQIYHGQFKNDYRNGKGYLFNIQQNKRYRGNFKNNMKNGKFTVANLKKQFSIQIKGNLNSQKNKSIENKSTTVYYHNDIEIQQQINDAGNRIYFFFISDFRIDERNLETLDKQNWLSPTILYAYCYLAINYYNKWTQINRGQKIRLMIYFWEKLVTQNFHQNSELQYNKITEFYPMNQRSPIFEYCKKFAFPIQISQSHFSFIYLVVIQQQTSIKFELSYMDSLRYQQQAAIQKIMRKYLKHELETKNQYLNPSKILKYNKAIDQMKIQNYKKWKLIMQSNQNDCGVWTALYVRNIIRNLMTGAQYNWEEYKTNDKIAEMRKQIKRIILTQQYSF